MNTQLRHIISIGLLFASLVRSSGAWAVDCPQFSNDLNTQAQVDAFPAGCDSVLGGIQVGFFEPGSLSEITSLGGLVNLTSVGRYLDIYDNDLLTNLDGLANLTSVGADLAIENNDALTNCQGLAPVLGWPSGPLDDSVVGEITIDSNATGCNSVEVILASYSKPLDPAILWFLLRPTYTEDEDE